MNILVLNGSPRPHGNTAASVNVFTDEAQKADHYVTVFQIGNKDIRG
ncbi:NAD(P)H-dependent oxidoreductase [Mediterraneibacter agrestimuris]|nr:NAD(P)H-dependent oxidoreductase [Mediterraneibacter agrestimuris]